MVFFVICVLLMFLPLVIGEQSALRRWRMRRRVAGAVQALFAADYMDARVFYTLLNRRAPNIHLVAGIDVSQAFEFIRVTCAHQLIDVYQASCFDKEEENNYFSYTFYVLKGSRLVVLGHSYAQLLFGQDDFAWAHDLAASIGRFRLEQERPRAETIGFTVAAMN